MEEWKDPRECFLLISSLTMLKRKERSALLPIFSLEVAIRNASGAAALTAIMSVCPRVHLQNARQIVVQLMLGLATECVILPSVW
jgi:hypothetical protein